MRTKKVTTTIGKEALAKVDPTRLARECAKLDKQEERSLAEEGLKQGINVWPEY